MNYKKATRNFYQLYSRSKKQCKNCPGFATCATDPGTVRINASAYYPSFYRYNQKVGTGGYLRVMRLRQIWAEGTFAVLKREHKLNKIQKRGLQKATEECLLLATPHVSLLIGMGFSATQSYIEGILCLSAYRFHTLYDWKQAGI